MRKSRLISGLSLFGGFAFAAGCTSRDIDSVGQTSAALATSVRIEQVYPAGGNSGALYNTDYVVLRNLTGSVANLAGNSLQYASGTGTWSTKLDLVGTIPANGYFLIGLSSGTTGAALPTVDQTGAIALSASAGKVALVTGTTLMATKCPATGAAPVLDLVAWGSTADCYEGAVGPAAAPTSAEEIYRTAETDNNQADFSVRAPAPRNSSGSDGGTVDAATEAGSDAGADAAPDATVDAATDAPSDAAPDAASDASDAAAETSADAGTPASLVLLNELRHNPVGTDVPYEYIELKCTPNGVLTGYQFVAFEGDWDSTGSDAGGNGPRGVADRVLDLNSVVCGSNGLVYIRASSGATASQDPATTEVAWPILDTTTSALENATTTFAHIKGGTLLVQGTDYDTNDDQTLELPSGAAIVDAVGTFAQSDGGVDFVYGGVTIALANGTEPEAVTRFPNNNDPLSAGAWYGGKLTGSDGHSVTYDSAAVTANFPTGTPKLTPGSANMGASPADAGPPDAKLDAAPDAKPPIDAAPDVVVVDAGQDTGSPVAPATDGGKKDATAVDGGAPIVVDGSGGCSAAPVGSAGGTFALGGLFALIAARLTRSRKR